MTDVSAHRAVLGARALFPGLLTALTVALAAKFLSEHYGAPVMLMALLLGMAFNFLAEADSRCAPGIEFASRTVLRLGVALLGLGITVQQVMALGIGVVGIVLAGVAVTIVAGVFFARLLGRDRSFGVLAGGAVAICGASAALAIASVLPNRENKERDTIFTVIGVTTLSTLAMIAYPILANTLGMSEHATGIFLGSTIHDVAQVVGAGYSVSDATGDTATIVKLFRVALLAPVVVLISVLFSTGGKRAGRGLPVPAFVIGFVVLVLVGSYDLVPPAVADAVLDLSRWCLVTAIAALGMKTSLKKLAEVGGGAVAMLVALTGLIATLSLTLILVFGI